MPYPCSVQGCKERNTGIHCLPVKDIEKGKTWLVAIKTPNYNVDENTSLEQWKNIRVCSKHFKSLDFKNISMGARTKTILKEDAIPSIFPWTLDSRRSSRETSPLQRKSPVETPPYEESCPGITFELSEFTFDEENNCSIKEDGESEENNCSNEAGEEEENEKETDDSDSDWEKEDSDPLESDDSDISEFNLDSELQENVRQLCPECGAFFLTRKGHTCEYKIKPFSCNDCGKRCVDESALKAHSIIHKESYEHPCKFCLAPFKTRPNKLAHEGAHVPSAKPYHCPDCSLTFAKLHARNRHLRDHRGPKILSCPHCALEFRSANHMERHILVHTDMKKYVCEFCSRSFKQQSHLKSHLRVHTGEKPFQCQYCDRRFSHNLSLKRHVMGYHREGASDFGPSGPVKRTKRAMLQSMGRPKGRPKRNGGVEEEAENQP